MSSRVVFTEREQTNGSRLVTAIEQLNEQFDNKINGQFFPIALINCGKATVNSQGLDVEFEVNFDNDLEANEAAITIYNMARSTINQFGVKEKITIWAGYGDDRGVIFEGYISSRKTTHEGGDLVTEIHALDDPKRQGQEVSSITYQKGTKASYILRDLCKKTGLPTAVFKTSRDYTYVEDVNVDGNLYDAIRQYAKVCGVSAYVCKQKIYVRPLGDGDNTRFRLSSATGLLSVSEFEENEKVSLERISRKDNAGKTTYESKEFNDTVKGFDVEMLLQHRLQTASIITLDTEDYKGTFRVRSGSHSYGSGNFVTKAKIIGV